MTSGYLSSDRKLNMHHILKASSLEMKSCFWPRFFLKHNVQHILLKSWRSKLSFAYCREKEGGRHEEDNKAGLVNYLFENKEESFFFSPTKKNSVSKDKTTWTFHCLELSHIFYVTSSIIEWILWTFSWKPSRKWCVTLNFNKNSTWLFFCFFHFWKSKSPKSDLHLNSAPCYTDAPE